MTRRSFFASLAALVGVRYAPKPQTFIGVDCGFGDDYTATCYADMSVVKPRRLGIITSVEGPRFTALQQTIERVRQREIQAFKERVARDLYACPPSRL